jgi:UDP-N-acetylglucosamine--N-acetylmuramyl-(pentapeptide) pyrophosphoryl-undecaprenol N-acetylglucosamine transferase
MIRQEQVDVVIGMGGYICVPGGLAAWIRKKPLLLVNADATLLMSNRLLQPFKRCTAMGFATENQRWVGKFIVTGNPVRHSIETITSPLQRFSNRSGPLRLLIMGGSLGARILNQIMPQVLAILPEENRPQVLHQTGTGHDVSVTQVYEELGLLPWVRVQPFIEDVAQALSQCDVVICRAGAITVSELCSAGVPSVLVPLVLGTTSHQKHNAQFMAQHGAAVHMDQNQLSPQALAQMIQTFNRENLLTMALRAHQLAQPHAAIKIVDEVAKWMGVHA